MKTAAVPGYRLHKATLSTRVLTSLGILGLFFGLLCSCVLTLSRTGVHPEQVARYYRGSESVEAELDGMLVASTAKSFDELAEVTHIHLMGGSLLLFLLCHLLSVCDVSERTRLVSYVVSFGSFLLTFLSPWLIVYVSAVFGWLFVPAMITLIVALFALSAIPLRDMWLKR